MWKILGVNAMYVEFADIWKERMMEISEERGTKKRFSEIMKDATVTHLLNGTSEIHTFMIDLPDSVSPEDIQFLADEILDIAMTAEFDFVSIEGEYQKCQVIFSGEREPEIIGLDKTEGYSSGAVFLPIVKGLSSNGRANDSLS
jgi:hypothetical protein